MPDEFRFLRVTGDQPGGLIRWRLHLAVPPEAVFAVLDSDQGRAAFWAESAREVEGKIQFRFINGQSYESDILRREPPRTFAIDYFGGPASFELESDGKGGTDLLLRHDGVPAEDWHEVHAGWLNVLFPLKAHLVHGVDLRNHDPHRVWELGYADQ